MTDVLKGVTAACSLVRYIVEGAEIIEHIENCVDNPEDRGLQVTSIALKSAALVLGVGETCAKSRGSSVGTLTVFKGTELLVRVCDFPVNLQVVGNDRNASAAKKIEKMFLAPMASILRTGAQLDCLGEERYLALTPEEMAKAERPIYEYDGDGDVRIVGYKPVIREECEKLLLEYQKSTASTSIVELGFKIGVMQHAVAPAVTRVDRLYQEMQRVTAEAAVQVRQAAAAATVRVGQALVQLGGGAQAPVVQGLVAQAPVAQQAAPQNEQLDPFDLRGRNTIPDALQNDVVFRRYSCGIMHTPIRHVVGDPDGVHLYERAHILEAIRRYGRSPMTNLPLTIAQLVPKPRIQLLINNQLATYEQQLRARAQEIENAPPPADLAADALAEAPQL